MKKQPYIILFVLFLSLVAFKCEDNSDSTFQEDQQELIDLKQNIEYLASTSVCNENTECKFMALGSKPCGGPWSYVIYSTSIDESNLKTLVTNYNKKEAAYNQKWGIVSDCAMVNPPISTTCKNNTCVAVY